MTDVVQGNVAGGGPEAEAMRGASFAINSSTSRLAIKTFAGGALSAFGHDLAFAVPIQGEIRFDAERLTGSVNVSILADAIRLQGDKSEKDRRDIERTMKEKVLEIARYAEILYEASQATVTKTNGSYNVEVSGSLTLHGVTRPLPLKAKVTSMGSLLRAFGEFTLRMSDYQIEQVTVAAGALKVKDEIKASFDISARP